MKKTFWLSMLAFFLGAFSFLSVLFIQVPIQRALTNSDFFYKINSLFIMALFYGLISALIQRIFTFIAAFFSDTFALAGFLSGLGFGLTESIYYIIPYFANFGFGFFLTVDFTSRLFSILFHASCTGIIMVGLSEKKFIQYFIPVVIIHATLNGLSVLSQTIKVYQLAFLFISIIVTIILFIYFLFVSKKMKIVLKEVTK